MVPEGVGVLREAARLEVIAHQLIHFPSRDAGAERLGREVNALHDGLVGAEHRLGYRAPFRSDGVIEPLQIGAISVSDDAKST